MIHAIIVRDPLVFELFKKQTGAKKIPLETPYEVYAHGAIRIIGGGAIPPKEILPSVMSEFNPDTVFFLSKSYPVSDEKLPGDIILPNVFFPYNPEVETMEIEKETVDSLLSLPIFLEHYALQGDYNFESFGLSVGGLHVSGQWNEWVEDFRIRLRLAYENDTFDSELYEFIAAAKEQKIQEKMYPVAYIGTDNTEQEAKNLWSIVGFLIGSIDPDLISEAEESQENETEEEWVDGSEED